MDNEFKKLDFHNLKLFLEDYFFFLTYFIGIEGLNFVSFLQDSYKIYLVMVEK